MPGIKITGKFTPAGAHKLLEVGDLDPTVGSVADGETMRRVGDDVVGYEDLVTINFIIEGGGEDIPTGTYGQIRNRSGRLDLRDVTLLAEPIGAITVDIWVTTYAGFPPSDADSICAGAVPAIVGGQKDFDDTLTGWRTGIDHGDIFNYNVDACTGIELVSITLGAIKRE